jgi:hypothetical protein
MSSVAAVAVAVVAEEAVAPAAVLDHHPPRAAVLR